MSAHFTFAGPALVLVLGVALIVALVLAAIELMFFGWLLVLMLADDNATPWRSAFALWRDMPPPWRLWMAK